MFMAQQVAQFFPHDFYDLVGRRETFQNIPSDGFFSNFLNKILNNLKIDIRFQECQPHFFQGIGNILLSQYGLAA